MKKLILFLTAQRCGSSVSAGIFHYHGVSLGAFPLFQSQPDHPLGLCESIPVFQIDHTLHKIVYGFQEDHLHYRLAGEIMKNRDVLRPQIEQIDPQLIAHGINVIRQLTADSEITALKHPAMILFWFYWSHVFSKIDGLEIHPVFLLRPPSGIASSYARRANQPKFEPVMFDLIEIYFKRLFEVYLNWQGKKEIVRFTSEHYHDDLRQAIEHCGLTWNEQRYLSEFNASVTKEVTHSVQHPVQNLYDHWLTYCVDESSLEKKNIYFVFGLHSSGTSCVAGVLHHLGVNMGDRLIGYYGNDPETNCGFEDQNLLQICRSALNIYSTTPKINDRFESHLKHWILYQKRKTLCGTKNVGGKHPLLCAFGEQLKRYCGDSLYGIFVDRPREISFKSIINRGDLKGDSELIKKHVEYLDGKKEELRNSLPPERRMTIEYEKLISNPENEIRRLALFLENKPGEQQILRAIQYVKPEMKHY
jgi:hypothetical protein